MGKPKTLKELQQHSPGKFGGMSRCEYKCSREIRKEVINHIKNKEQNEGFGLTPDVVQWLKCFFSITDEELI